MEKNVRPDKAGAIIWAGGRYPVGVIFIAMSARGVRGLCISADNGEAAFVEGLRRRYGVEPIESKGPLKEAFKWLDKYFAGRFLPFPLPLDPVGTDFEKMVWRAIALIPPEETRTYGQLAASVGRPLAARAVGGACGRNPIPVIIPCHRVVSGSGPGGYTGGLHIKRALLEIEGVRI